MKRKKVLAVFLFIVAVGLAAYLFYRGMFPPVPTLTPLQAQRMLQEEDGKAVLVDVRDAQQFGASHIEGSIHWPLQEIRAIKSSEKIPKPLKGKKLLMICNSGVLSHLATAHLRELDANVFNVRGGVKGWRAETERARENASDSP